MELFKRHNLHRRTKQGNPDKQRAKQFDKLVSCAKALRGPKVLAGFDDNDEPAKLLPSAAAETRDHA